MTIAEAHIEFDLLLAQVGSYVGDYVSPHKKDWFLTIAQLQFLKDHIARLKKGVYEDLRIDVEAIQGLKATASRPVNIGTGEMFSILPADYVSGISETLEVSSVCATTAPDTISATPTYLAFKFNPAYSPEAVANKFINFSIVVNYDVDSYTAFQLSTYFPAGIEPDMWWYIIPIILRYAKRPGLDIYWERWNTTYRPGHFIFVQETGLDQVFASITVTYNISPLQQAFISVFNFGLIRYIRPETYDIVDTRLLSSEHRQRVKNNPFRKSRKKSPVTSIRGNNLIIDGNFPVFNAHFEYYRLPAPVNHVTGQGFEIAAGLGTQELVERQIISTAVRKATAANESGNYQITSAESILDQ